jgi:hypothetical protein
MKRFIRLDNDNKVVGVRYGKTVVEGEIESSMGEVGQIKQGEIFVDSEPVIPEPSQLDRIEQNILKIMVKLGVE